jgi:hypothetical protein
MYLDYKGDSSSHSIGKKDQVLMEGLLVYLFRY